MAPVKRKKVKLTAKFLKKKNKNTKKASQTDDKSREPFCCPKCKALLVGMEAVRLRSRPKLTKHMQKLLRKRELNEESLTLRQRELVQRAMQQCNTLVMKCSHCHWQAEIQLESRESHHRRRARLQQRAKEDRQQEFLEAVEEDSQPVDKKAQKKLKKKERRKKVAEAKARDLQQFKRFSVSGVSERCDEQPLSLTPRSSSSSSLSVSPFPSQPGKSALRGKPMTPVTPQAGHKPSQLTAQSAHRRAGSSGPVSGVHKRKVHTPGKQQLRSILNQQKKDSLSAKDSLSQFLNSLK